MLYVCVCVCEVNVFFMDSMAFSWTEKQFKHMNLIVSHTRCCCCWCRILSFTLSHSVVFIFFFIHFAFMCEWICNTNVQTQLLFVHFKKNEIHFILFSSLFCFALFFFLHSFWSIWQSTFTFIILMECWQFQKKREKNHSLTPAQEKSKGAKRIPFNAHMIAMFTQIIPLLYNKMHWFESMKAVEEKHRAVFFPFILHEYFGVVHWTCEPKKNLRTKFVSCSVIWWWCLHA